MEFENIFICVEVFCWYLCLFTVLSCVMNYSMLFMFVSLVSGLSGCLHTFPKWFACPHLEQHFPMSDIYKVNLWCHGICNSSGVHYCNSLYCVGFCQFGLFSLSCQSLCSLWRHLGFHSVPFMILPFCPNSVPAHLLSHWSFITLSFLLIWIIILLSLIPLMNCSFNLLSFSLYSHSLNITLRRPIHSSAFSFLPLLIFSIGKTILFYCAEVGISPLAPGTALCLSYTFLSHCHLMFG